MAGSTRHYGLAYFDFGDQLNAPLNVQKEIDRFVVIDKQLYGLYSVFGNGVLDGWTVSDNGFSTQNGISLVVSPGKGIIRYIAAETTFPATINNLPPLSVFDVYAVLQGSTARTRTIAFTYSQTALGDFAIKLARVTTGNNGINTIDNTQRDLIGFEEIIRQEIDSHKHRGTPSKIDLQNEVKNQLSGANIEGIDASKITSGTIPVDQLPIIKHEDLEYDGLLTHPQLDSFVSTLGENNKELLGEVASVNLLKHIIFMKYKFSDIDEHFINELAIIPGISSNDFIDFDASTASVNLDQQCISGVPPASGEFTDIFFNTRTAFQNAFKLTNVDVNADGTVTLARDESTRDIIEDFESVSADNQNIPGFTLSDQVVVDNLFVKSESTDTLRLDGFYSGRFSTSRDYRQVFTKTFSSNRDWTNFDELVVNVKTLSSSHGSVFAYFVNDEDGVESPSSNFLLLANDEITDNPDTSKNDFETKTFDISTIDRNNVTKFVVFSNDSSGNFEFYLDEIYVQNQSLYKPQGTIRLRYSTEVPITFHSLFFDIIEPTDTGSLVKVKVASSSALLSRASFTRGITDGQVFALPGNDIEIEVTLTSSSRTLTPVLSSVMLRILAATDTHGFNIDDQTDWALGTTKNIDIVPYSGTKSRLQLDTPINVGGLYFSNADAVSEISNEDIGVLGFSGVNMPLSLPQAFNFFNESISGFDNVSSCIRTIEKNFIIADTYNDRVVLTDSSGGLVKGFFGVSSVAAEFFPALASYNPNNFILTIVTSRPTDRSSIVLANISLFIGSTELKLSDKDTLVTTVKSDQIIEIKLSADKANQLINQTTNLYIDFSAGAFAEDISTSEQAGALIGTRGLTVSVGDIEYVSFIRKPVFGNILTNNNWIICNGSTETEVIEDSDDSPRKIPSLIEFDPTDSSNPDFTYSDIEFSEYSLGGVVELPLNRLGVAGIKLKEEANSTTVSSSSETVLYRIEYDNFVNGSLSSASSVVLESNDGTYGVRAIGTENVVVEAGTSMIQQDTGKYLYTFEAAAGLTFDAVIKKTQTTGGEAEFITASVTNMNKESDSFKSEAQAALDGYRGTVAIINRITNQKTFEYTSPDGLYAASVDVDLSNQLVVAETDVENNNGRVIKLDSFGNIIFQYGQGNLGIVKSARALTNGNYILSL